MDNNIMKQINQHDYPYQQQVVGDPNMQYQQTPIYGQPGLQQPINGQTGQPYQQQYERDPQYQQQPMMAQPG